ncbi:hypothetical protein L7F22_007464 [Adiantum nelumboides]|nr:hypothetical protein [Adiantum nelumboides]
MRAWFLSGFNSRKLREQEVPSPTKKFTELVHRALKLEQHAKKEKSIHRSSSESNTNASESEKSSSSSSESEEDDRKKEEGSWSRKIDEMSKKISEISGTEQQQNTASINGYIGRDRERGRLSSGDFKRNFNYYKCGRYGHFVAQCPDPDKPAAPEAKQPEPIPVRAITRSSRVVIEELPEEAPVPSNLNPKDKEWEQQRSTWKENDTLLLETQAAGANAIPIGSSNISSNFDNEQDEVKIKMCQRIQQLTIELKDIRQSLPPVAKFIKNKRKQTEAMTVEVPQIKDEVPVIQLDYKNTKQWEPLSGVILDGGARVNIIGEYMKEKMSITNIKPTPFRWYQRTVDFSSTGSPIQIFPQHLWLQAKDSRIPPHQDAGGDHNEDYGNEYGPPLPTHEELREMEHRRLVGEATNMMLNFAKDPKLAKYMTETVFQDVHAQWKATTTSPSKPNSKKQYSEKENCSDSWRTRQRQKARQKAEEKHRFSRLLGQSVDFRQSKEAKEACTSS